MNSCVVTPLEDLAKAVEHCFLTPCPETLARFEGLLADEPDELMRQCVAIVQTANALLDAEGRQLAGIFREQGKPVVCKPGCTGCCHQLVLCQPFEARNIRAYLETQPKSLLAFERAYTLWDKATVSLRHSYLTWAENRYGQNEDDGSHTVEDYNVPCPFLDNTGHCLIYPVRPYACRTCIALEPACATNEHAGKHTMQYSLYTTHHATRTAITSLLLSRLGLSSAQPVPMPEMLASLNRA